MPRKLLYKDGQGDGRGEASCHPGHAETPKAGEGHGHSGTGPDMEAVVARANLFFALKRVKQNQGSPGIDGMTVKELTPYLREAWPKLREQLLAGVYQPTPVRPKARLSI